jgi:excisionase family DNA binding protein
MPLLKVPQVAELLACSNATVYALIEQGLLPAVKIGVGNGGVRVRREDLDSFVESRRTGRPAARVKTLVLKHLR